MDWTKWIADLLAAGIGAFVASLIAFRTNYSAKKGEHRADYEDRDFVLGQERGKAFEQEAGKRLATHEDIENVLKEVRAVTRETETIRAQIGNDLWTRQAVWNQKRLSYSAIMREAHEFLMSVQEIASSLTNKDDLVKALTSHKALFIRVGTAFLEAEIVISEEASELLGEFRDKTTKIVYTPDDPELREFAGFVGGWVYEVSQAAKRDLGIASYE